MLWASRHLLFIVIHQVEDPHSSLVMTIARPIDRVHLAIVRPNVMTIGLLDSTDSQLRLWLSFLVQPCLSNFLAAVTARFRVDSSPVGSCSAPKR